MGAVLESRWASVRASKHVKWLATAVSDWYVHRYVPTASTLSAAIHLYFLETPCP